MNKLLPLLLTSSLIALGCDSSDDLDGGVTDTGLRPDAQAVTDAGPRPDAQVGPDAVTFPDAQEGTDADTQPDAEVGPDATSPDASAPAPVTVRVYLPGGQPLPFTAVFHDPTGAVVSSTVAAGEASALLPPGSMVSVVASRLTGKGGGADGLIFTGVQPGDVYELGPDFRDSEYVGDLEVQLPGFYRKEEDSYRVEFGCGGYYVNDPSSSFTQSVYTDCAGSSTTTTSVLATVWDSDGALLAYSAVEDVPLTPVGSTQVSLGPWQSVIEDASLTVTNVSTAATTLYGEYGLVRQQQAFLWQWGVQSSPSPGTVVLPFSAIDFGDGDLRLFELAYADGGQSAHLQRRASRGPLTIDAAADLLPPVMERTVTPTTDDARPDFSWVLPPQTADGGILRFRTHDTSVTWMLVVPPGSNTLRFPELPLELEHLAPDLTQGHDDGFLLFEANLVPGYDVFRTQVVPAFFRRGLYGTLLDPRVPVGLQAKISQADFFGLSPN